MRGRLRIVLAGALLAACGAAIGAEDDGVVLPDRTEPDADTDAQSASEVGAPDTSTTDTNVAPDAADASTGLRVFVSSTTSNSNMGGLAGADLKCTNLAIDANLGGKWAAWLSNQDGPHAIDRVTSSGPWSLVTGELVASNKAELASGTLKHAIDHDEKKATVLPGRVWTGTGPNGRYSTNDCDKWRNGGNGRVGESSLTNSTWTSAEVRDCGNLFRIFCFEL